MNESLVSVVITTKNEEKHIANCLESVRRQTYNQDKIEIIVVDNNSTDETKIIAQKYTPNIFNKGPERSAQRNFGMMEKSQGKYLIYLDADMILSPTVIARSVEKLEGSDLLALYIPEIVLGSSFWSSVRRFERSFYDGTVIDCVRIIRKDIFEKVGGFDPAFTGQEDWDLDKKIRARGRVAVLGHYDFAETNRAMKKLDYFSALSESPKPPRSGMSAAPTKRELKPKCEEAPRLRPRGGRHFGGDLVNGLGNASSVALIYHNETEFSIKRYLSKKGYYLKTFAAYIKKWGRSDADVRKQVGAAYRLFWVFVEDGKWRRLLKYPLLAMGMYFLRFLVGFCFLVSKFR